MRFWEFGIFDSQHSDWTQAVYSGFRSILSAGSTTNSVGSAYYNDTGITPRNAGDTGGDAARSSWLIRILTDQIKAKLGQIPVLVTVDITLMTSSENTVRFQFFRVLDTVGIDILDSNNRYKDISGVIPWYEDTYAPYGGQDRQRDGEASGDTGYGYQVTNQGRAVTSITDIVERALRDNTDIWLYFWPRENLMGYYWNPVALPQKRPTLRFSYFYPIEFYKDDGAGNIDLTEIIGDTDENIYYLGAVERGQTGSSIKSHVRNMSRATANIEIFDDHPEYRNPLQRVGSGTGQLDYAELLEPAVSQLYTIVFYSSTEYEVKAEKWRDNATSLHPQIDADASWRGNTGATFTAPEGGFRIPAAAWQPGTLTGDEIEVSVRGNTTDTTWPPDSNDQVQMTHDLAGSPDGAGWRPISGRREFSRDTVTVDAATKFFPTRRVAPTEWPIGTPAFVQDADSIDEGTVNDVQEAALGAVTFSGSGVDDLARSGNYNGNEDRVYRVTIDGTGAPDTFKWSNDDGGSDEATGVPITGALQLLEDGVYVLFTATTGHTSADFWKWNADTYGIELTGLTPGSNGYAAGSIVATTLPFRSLAPAIFSALSADSGSAQPNPARIYLSSTVGFVVGATIYIQQAGTTVSEVGIIAVGGVTSAYIDLETSLANDYQAGDFCTQQGAGDDSFWLRPVATGVTVEELKRLRLNARIL